MVVSVSYVKNVVRLSMAQFSEEVLQVIIFFLIQVILNSEYILGNLTEYYTPMKKRTFDLRKSFWVQTISDKCYKNKFETLKFYANNMLTIYVKSSIINTWSISSKIIYKGEITMKKMNENAMKAVNGGGYYRCVWPCGQKFKYKDGNLLSEWSMAVVYNAHLSGCIYAIRWQSGKWY